MSDTIVEQGTGACQVAITVTPEGSPIIAYGVTSTTPAQVRLARRTSNGDFAVELVALDHSATTALSVSTDPSDQPVVAYLAKDGVRVARPNLVGAQPWPSDVAIATTNTTGSLAQVLVDATGRIHVVCGDPYNYPSGVLWSAYNRSSPAGTWTTSTAQNIEGGITHRPMVLDDEGNVTIFTSINAESSGPRAESEGNYVRAMRVAPDGSLNTEWVEAASTRSGAFAVKGYDGRVGSVSTQFVRTRRIAANLYQRVARADLKSVEDAVIGHDGAVRAFGLTPDGDPMLLTEPCTRFCAGQNCGDDGCGGHCGTCGSCQSCDPERRLCNTLSSERVSTLAYPLVLSAAPLVDGSLLVALGVNPGDIGSRYLFGNSGIWTQKTDPLTIGSLVSSPDSRQLWALGRQFNLWNGSGFVHRTTFNVNESVGEVSVGNDGTIHRLYAPSADRIAYATIPLTGTSTSQTLTSDATLTFRPISMQVSASGKRYAIYETRRIASPFTLTYYLGVAPPTGEFTFEQTPNEILYGSPSYYVVDDDETEWFVFPQCGGGSSYLFRPKGASTWTRQACAPSGSPAMVPTGILGWVFTWDRQLRLAAQDGIYARNAMTGRFDRVVEVPTQVALYDARDRLHVFYMESVNGIDQLRHFYQP
jgi:hypothetical protein